MKYRFRARGSNSTYFVGVTKDLIVIPEQNGDMGIFNKSQLDNDFLTSDLRYEINLISNANKELNGVLKATSKNDNKIDISGLKPARYNLTPYKGNKVVFSESFEKR